METPETAGAAPEGGVVEAPQSNPVEDRVNELASSLNSFQETVLQRLPEPEQPEPEPEADLWADFLNAGEPEQPEPPQQQGLDPQMLRAAVDQAIEAATGPLQAELQQLRTEQDYSRLMTDYPELQDPEVRAATGQAAREKAEAILGAQYAGALTNSADFIALVHEAQAGRRGANGEVPAGGDPHQLEGGGGTSPAAGEQPNIVQQAMAMRRQLPKGLR